MRVNVDEQAITEPRIKRMARKLGRSHFEVLGRLLPVWMLCYQRRSPVVSAVDIDITADLDGFAEAMVSEEMAETGDDGIYVRGVTERIEFLERQVQKGRKSGEVRRAKNTGSTSVRAPAQQVFGGGSNQHRTDVEPDAKSGRAKSGTYSPDLDLDQAPDQALDLKHRVPAAKVGGGDAETARSAGDASDRSGSVSGPTPEGDGVEESKTPASRSHARTAHVAVALPEPPVPALTTASILMDYLLRNHPNSKLAKCSETQRENTLLKWAHDVRLMHEVDHHEYGAIQAMIHWCQREPFWLTVILSAGNLRDKYDKMDAQRRRPRGTSPSKAEPNADEVARQREKQRADDAAEMARIKAKEQAASAERHDVASAMGELKQKLGIAPGGATAMDAGPEPMEDEADAL